MACKSSGAPKIYFVSAIYSFAWQTRSCSMHDGPQLQCQCRLCAILWATARKRRAGRRDSARHITAVARGFDWGHLSIEHVPHHCRHGRSIEGILAAITAVCEICVPETVLWNRCYMSLRLHPSSCNWNEIPPKVVQWVERSYHTRMLLEGFSTSLHSPSMLPFAKSMSTTDCCLESSIMLCTRTSCVHMRGPASSFLPCFPGTRQASWSCAMARATSLRSMILRLQLSRNTYIACSCLSSTRACHSGVPGWHRMRCPSTALSCRLYSPTSDSPCN